MLAAFATFARLFAGFSALATHGIVRRVVRDGGYRTRRKRRQVAENIAGVNTDCGRRGCSTRPICIQILIHLAYIGI